MTRGESIFAADVGDGLCALYQTVDGERIVTDCGSYAPRRALCGLRRSIARLGPPGSIIVSHLHWDHYSGFVWNRLHPSVTFQVESIYYPRLPQFPDAQEQRLVFYALMALNARLLGARTGVAEYEFLQTIRAMNDRDIRFRAVTQGDFLRVGSEEFEILWPPRILPDREEVRGRIRRAIDLFSRAVDEDPETKELYERVRDEGMFDTTQFEGEGLQRYRENDSLHLVDRQLEERQLPQVVREASSAIRRAANDFSIALRNVGNSFVFMGDLEVENLPDVVGILERRGSLTPHNMITPHHGTHWHDALLKFHSMNSLTSNGPRWAHKWSPMHKKTARRTLATHVNGDLSA